MVGTPECKVFFEQKLQLARRSTGLYYQPLEFNEYFTNFCRTMFDYQYTQKKTDLTEAFIEWLYEHSGGLISVVVSLLHDAQEIAILSGHEKIDLKSFNDAYEKRTAMLHGYFKERYITLPRTGKNQKKTDQAKLEKLPTLTSCASKKYQSKNKMFDTSQRLQRIKQFVDKQRKIISQHFVDQSGTKSTKSFGENSFGLKLL